MPVVEVKSAKHFDELLLAHPRVAVDFGATWCQPCKKMAPVFHKLSETYKNILFVSVDVDLCEDVHERPEWGPEAAQVPTFVFIHKTKTLPTLTCGGILEKINAALNTLSKL
jgi:thiol-disulfide isomerase/thioredoxin